MIEAAFAAQDAAALLRWYVDHGIDETIGEEAIDRFALPPPAAVAAAPAASTGPAASSPAAPTPIRAPIAPPVARAPVPLESPQLAEDAREVSRRATTIAELEEAVRAFEGCALKRTAKNTVFADGVAGAPVMIVGEAPGRRRGPARQAVRRRQRPAHGPHVLGHRHESRARPLHHQHSLLAAAGQPHADFVRAGDLPRLHAPPHRTRQAEDRGAGRRHRSEGRPEHDRGHHRLRGKWTTLTLDDAPRSRSSRPSTPPICCAPPASKRQSWADLLSLDKRLKELGVR